MTPRLPHRVTTAVQLGFLAAAAACLLPGQTLINLGTQGRNVDFTTNPYTRPVKTGTTLPSACSPGDMFFNTAASPGQNLYGCPATNTWIPLSDGGTAGLADPGANGVVLRTALNTTSAVAAPTGTIVGTTDTQTLTNKSINASEINSGTLSSAQMPALSGDVTSSAGSTATTLATVNSTPGIYGDGSHSVQITVDGKGRVTAVTAVAITGGGGGSGGGSITAGPLGSISGTCTPGTLYFATDQPAGQQVYTCSATNTWTQMEAVGPSGALVVTNGALDIVTSVVPRLAAANTFTGLNSFNNGILMAPTGTQPSCSSSTRGMFWYLNNGASKDNVQVCVYNGSAYAWINLY